MPVSTPTSLSRIVRQGAVLVLGLVLVASGSLAVSNPAQAAENVVRGSSNYGKAVAAMDGEVVLWRPTYTAAVRRKGPIDVIAYGKGRGRATFAGSTYGRRVPSFTLAQKSAQTRWAAIPVDRATSRLVGTEAIRLGEPGAKRVVRARIYANCGTQSGVPRRCVPTDVARFGGSVELLARTPVAGGQAATDIRIDSNGLSYRQLLRVARGLVPVTP